MPHRPTAVALAALVLSATGLPPAAPAAAEERPAIGWSDLIAPDRVLALLAQTAVAALRSQGELRYDTLTTDFAAGSLAVVGLVARPLPGPAGRPGCTLAADRLAISGLPTLASGNLAVRAEVMGASIAAPCFDRDLRFALETLGADPLRLDRAVLTFDYALGPGTADIGLQAVVPGLGTLEGAAHLPYAALAEGLRGDPLPMVRFGTAHATFEDGGLLDLLRGLIPELGDPAGAARTLRAELEGDLRRENARADRRRDASAVHAEAPLTPEQLRLAETLEAEVARFLRGGGAITLALAAPAGEALVDVAAFEADPRRAFAALNPVLRAAPPARAAIVPAALLAAALSAPRTLSGEDRRRVGRALLTGQGAPRDPARGVALLAPLALAGDGRVAADLARALAGTDPAEAYGYALRAAARGAPGALALLDRLEAGLDLAAVLAAQQAVGGAGLPEAPFASVAAAREEALARATGTARTRDYLQAWFWAGLGAAAGDAAAAGLRAEIEARIAARGPAAAAVWAEASAPVAERLLREWIARDLPGRFGAD